ncbi:MAG: tetratricopeptide repeat protein [Reichenbachiella sp.]
MAKENDDQILLSEVFNKLGVFYYNQTDLEKSTEYYFKALDGLFDHTDHFELLGRLNNNIGWNFHSQRDYVRAMNYYKKSETYARQLDSKELLGVLFNNIGVVLKNQEQYKDALKYFKDALKINRDLQNVSQQLYNINNIGVIYLLTERYSLATEYFGEALKINYSLNELAEATNNLHNIGQSLFKSGEIKIAKDSLTHALEMANKLELPELKRLILKDLYDITKSEKQFEQALNYYTKYKSMDDSLYRKGQYTSLVELEAKYKVSKNERTIQLSNTQLLNQRLINAVILAALFIALLFIIFLIWIYSTKKKNEKKLLSLNIEIDSKNAKIQAINQNLEQIIEQRTKTIQDQNNQLKEFAFMNSHKVRRPLSSILGIINLLKEEKRPDKIQELISMVDDSAQEMDAIIFEINNHLRDENI